MPHLDETQLLDALEAKLEATLEGKLAAAHLADCGACRDRVSELRSVIASVTSVEVPEPSPLFWDHFPARVSRAIDAAPSPAGWWRSPRWLWGGAATAALVMLLMLLPLGREAGAPAPTSDVEAPTTVASAEPNPDVLGSLEVADGLEGDAAWEMVRAVAEESDYDAVQESGLVPRAGSLERAALELSTEERAELARLVAQEIQNAQEIQKMKGTP